MKRFFLISFFIFLCSALSGNSHAKSIYSANVHTQIVSAHASIQPDQIFKAAIHFKMDPDWHIYWRNPGDSGISPYIEWMLPEGVTVSEFQWPEPEFIPVDPLMTYGYHGEVLLLFDVYVDPSYSGKYMTLQGHLEYLACKTICVPGKADLNIILPVASESSVNQQWHKVIQLTQNKLPLTDRRLDFAVVDDGDAYTIQWQGGAAEAGNKLYFFPYRDDIIDHFKEQKYSYHKNLHQLRVFKSEYHPDQLDEVQGIIYAENGWTRTHKTIEVESPIYENVEDAFTAESSGISVWVALGFAFLGGLILNLMPCVLPVLSIKILNIIQQTQNNRRDILHKGLLFSTGILVAFWALAFLLIALKSAGQSIGWGFQFQSPVFVIMMMLLFGLMALNLFGVFEVGVSFTRFRLPGLSGSFWEGVLATIVATPCTAPFMGSALAYALTQSAAASFLIFTFLGVGMATPFLILILSPSLLKFVPKPGPWMIHLKRFFACLFLLTVLWLGWILSVQIGAGAPKQTENTQEALVWEKFSPELLEKYRSGGRVVFLDFTARWCLTCQVNDRVALSNPKVIDRFKELDIVMMKADWTNYDEVITKALAKLGRNAIPLYVLYPENRGKPLLLPELLTPKIVLDYLNQQDEK